MGFAKAFYKRDFKLLKRPVSKQAGILWMLVAILFIFSGLFLFFGKETYWILFTFAIVFSQLLLFQYWKEAKYGTLVNVLLVLIAFFQLLGWHFYQKLEKEVADFQSINVTGQQVITAEMLSDLPTAVQQWLKAARVIGSPKTETAYIQQSGEMRTSQDGEWTLFNAVQWVRTNEPGFIWIAEIGSSNEPLMLVRDNYLQSEGTMSVKLLAAIPLEEVSGQEIDQGAALRYLAEMVWYPGAALQPTIQWEAMGSRTARGKLKYKNIEVTATFLFNARGDVRAIEAKRFYVANGHSSLENWRIDIDENSYHLFDSIRIPAVATVTWKLKKGDFRWLKVRVKEIRYNERVDFAQANSR